MRERRLLSPQPCNTDKVWPTSYQVIFSYFLNTPSFFVCTPEHTSLLTIAHLLIETFQLIIFSFCFMLFFTVSVLRLPPECKFFLSILKINVIMHFFDMSVDLESIMCQLQVGSKVVE